MGYQETLVTTYKKKDFKKLLNVVQSMNKDDFFTHNPIRVVTLKQDIKGDYSFQLNPNKKFHFKKGTQFILFCGERYELTSCSSTLLYHDIANKCHSIFLECLPYEEMFKENSDLVKVENFEFNKKDKSNFFEKTIRFVDILLNKKQRR